MADDTGTQAQIEPIIELRSGDCLLTLVGTAHVSRASVEAVQRQFAADDYDAVAVELCHHRYQALLAPQHQADWDLLAIIRQGRVAMVSASLALSAYQRRIAEQFGIEPGAEQKAAIDLAQDAGLPLLLIDRDIGITLKRTARSLSWWRRATLFSGLLVSLLSREKIDEEEIEQLKQGDMLEATFSEFASQREDLYQPLLAERDQYMAASLSRDIAEQGLKRVLVVIGAGHLAGTARHLEQGVADPLAELQRLEQTPPPARWPKLIPWLIVALVVAGFVAGFRQSPDLGWQLVREWVLINGGLSALGALLATAHPLTILTAFVAAPLTSLNPAVGAGMVTAAVEALLRRPRLGDFSRLRDDTTHPAGWWRNRVSRTLLVFLFSTLGSALGTYLAGFRIAGRLSGG
jgi:pheromone shutdown-related protein TraB